MKIQRVKVEAEILVKDYDHEYHDDLVSAAEYFAETISDALEREIDGLAEDEGYRIQHAVSVGAEDYELED